METKDIFAQNGYVHLKDFLDKDNCNQLVVELRKLVEQGKTTRDPQCPKSDAIHGAPVFDSLLEQLTPHFETASGKKLFPTYAYARLYSEHGEELAVHRDRPSCEISATLTLGFEGDVWPIYMGHNEDKTEATEVKMNVGDAVLYRGMDVYHWREKYKEGKWQAQVFLHYVDQNGPHAEWKYDKRPQLSHHQDPNMLSEYYVLEGAMSDAFCDKIIEEYSKKEVEKLPPIIGQGEGTVDLSIRNVQRLMLPMNQGVGATLTSIGLNINHQFYKYDITHSNQTEFLMYEPDGRYTAHVDAFHARSDETRKLTSLVFLNDDFEGGKFYLQTGHQKTYPPQKKGTVVVFPSYQLHGVEDVIKGNRYTAVTWLVGPYFK